MPANDPLKTMLASSTPPDQMREDMRLLAKRSTYFMGKAVCGFKDLDPDLHAMMAEWIQRPTTRKLGLAPRGHLKTSVWTIADTLRLIANDPNERIAIFNEVFENASAMLGHIAAIVENNAVFQWLFPEVIPKFDDVVWNTQRLTFNRTEHYKEATIEAFGVGQASTSRHYTYITEDDLIGKNAAESPATMKAAIDQHVLSESLLVSPAHCIRTIGTRWAPNDLPEWILQNEPDIDYLCLSIFRPDGTPIWPTRFSAKEIESLKRKWASRPGFFALQYENRVIASGATEFLPSWLRYWHWGKDAAGEDIIVLERPPSEGGPVAWKLEQLGRFGMIDAGIAVHKDADQTAIVTVGLTPERIENEEGIGERTAFDIIVLQADARRTSPKQTVANAWESYVRWKQTLMGIETVSAHLTFFYWIPTVYPNLPLRRLTPDRNEPKNSRIRSMGAFGEQGRIYVHRSMGDFIDEWCAFPSPLSSKNLLDAFAYGPDIWAPPEGDDMVPAKQQWNYGEEENPYDGRSPITGY